MDSIFIIQEVIDFLVVIIKDFFDFVVCVVDIIYCVMMGEFEFDFVFCECVKLFVGFLGMFFNEFCFVFDVINGVRLLIKVFKRFGVKIVVLLGGFLFLISWLVGELGIDYVYVNEVVIDEQIGKLIGEVKGRIVGKERKRELLIEIVEKEGIVFEQVVVVGDGVNDLLMMEVVGLGVVWNVKFMVQMEVSLRLNGDSFLDLLYLFGFIEEEVRQFLVQDREGDMN